MCLQCDTKAIVVVDNVLPGYKLMVATLTHVKWPSGHFGLVRFNDPDFVFPAPIGDPTIGMSDEAFDDLPPDGPIASGFRRHLAFVQEIKPLFRTDPMTGYCLVKACMEAGYDPETDGSVVVAWLVDHLAQAIEAAASEVTNHENNLA